MWRTSPLLAVITVPGIPAPATMALREKPSGATLAFKIGRLIKTSAAETTERTERSPASLAKDLEPIAEIFRMSVVKAQLRLILIAFEFRIFA